ncbi:MAG: hypothetical protein ABI594_16115 [Ginsengibacter sp.]
MRSTGLMDDAPGETSKVIDGIEYRKGDTVRLKLGKRRSDAMDLLLDNKLATIEIIYIDYDDKVYLAVTINEDPGQDMAREFGRYLFFSPDEVEVIK